MKMDINGDSKIAIIENGEALITDAQSALDLMATAHYNDCYKILLPKSAICEDFFDLKTGLAGEILQKAVNYHMQLAIVGDFSVYSSKALRDFIYESNRGAHVLFLEQENTALERLHAL